jgi:hypothetical protein
MSRTSKHFGKPATAVLMSLSGNFVTAKFSDKLENPQTLTQLSQKSGSHALSSTSEYITIRSQEILSAGESYDKMYSGIPQSDVFSLYRAEVKDLQNVYTLEKS